MPSVSLPVGDAGGVVAANALSRGDPQRASFCQRVTLCRSRLGKIFVPVLLGRSLSGMLAGAQVHDRAVVAGEQKLSVALDREGGDQAVIGVRRIRRPSAACSSSADRQRARRARWY